MFHSKADSIMFVLRLVPVFILLILSSAWAKPATPKDIRSYEFDEAYSLFMNKQKVGYELFSRTVDARNQTMQEKTFDVIRMNVGGTSSEDISDEKVTFSTADGMVESFSLRQISGKSEDLITGKRKGDKILIEQDGVFRVVPQPRANLNQEQEFLDWLATARPQDTFQRYEIDWEREPIDVPGEFTFLGRRPVVVSGVKTQVYQVKGVSDGLALLIDLNEQGVPLTIKDEAGFLELRRERKENAQKLEETKLDLFSETGISLETKLGKGFVRQLDLVASGTVDYQFPTTSYQRAEVLGEKRHRLHLVSRENPEPEALEDRKRYLKSTPTLQTSSAAVRGVLEKLQLKGSPRQRVETLNDWVYDNLEKSYTVNATTATAVLKNMAGDCTEHTLLLTTLARAEGIPAREVTGLIYAGDELGKFVHHAWVEVYVDGGWMAADPAFDQFPADATHILLARENDLSGVIGTVDLELKVARSPQGFGMVFWLSVLLSGLSVLVLFAVVYGVRIQEG